MTNSISKMSVVPVEQSIKAQLLKSASSRVASSQDLARERRLAEPVQDAPAAEPPMPAPSQPPSEDEPEEADGQNEANSSISKHLEGKPLSKNIVIFKRHVKVTLSGEYRKFEEKEWGIMDEGLPLLAAQIFEEVARAHLHRFDSFGRSPSDRHAMLDAACCDPKFKAKGKSIAVQRGALLQRLCIGKVESIEQEIVDGILQKNVGDLDPTCCRIKRSANEFLASFRGGNECVDKTFPSITRAMRWLQTMAIANKDYVFASSKSAVRIWGNKSYEFSI